MASPIICCKILEAITDAVNEQSKLSALYFINNMVTNSRTQRNAVIKDSVTYFRVAVTDFLVGSDESKVSHLMIVKNYYLVEDS